MEDRQAGPVPGPGDHRASSLANLSPRPGGGFAERSRSRGHAATTSIKSHFLVSLEGVCLSNISAVGLPCQAALESMATAASQSYSQLTKKLQH